MSRKRKRSFVSSNFKRQRVSFKAPSVIAVRALNKVNKLARMVKPQVKATDTFLVSHTVVQAGRIDFLNSNVPEGIANNHRIGNNIRVIGIDIRALIFRNTGASTTILRCIILRDKQQVADSKDAVTTVLSTANPLSPFSTANAGRYAVLRDRSFILTAADDIKIWHWKIKLNIVQRYNGSLSTDIQKNGFIILTVSNQTSFPPIIEYVSRMIYTDA